MRFHIGVYLLLIATPISGQSAPSGPTDRGSMLIFGAANFSHNDADGVKSTGFGVQPGVLYFFANRLALGGEVGLAYNNFKGGHSMSWGLGPAVRLYFGPSTSKTIPYVGAAVEFGAANFSNDNPEASDSDTSQWSAEAVAGLTFMISRQVGIAGEAFARRRSSTFESSTGNQSTNKLTQYGLHFGVAAFVF